MVKKETSKNNKLISTSTFIVLSLLIGIVVGFSLGSPSPNSGDENISHENQEIQEDHDHSTHEHDIHSHEKLEITTENIPTLDINIIEDQKKGYNLELTTTHFNFVSPANFNTHNNTNLISSGHAHLYVNGEKITRIYSNSYYLGELVGHNEITVTLNSNDHEDYTLNGEVIKSTQIIMS